SAATERIVGSASCQPDGTYRLVWSPLDGTTFDQSFAPTVYSKTGSATIYTKTSAYSPVVTAGAATMVVPGDLAGDYRVQLAYRNAENTAYVVIADVSVDGTCAAVKEAAAAGPTVAPICGANNDEVTLPTTEGVSYTASGWTNGVNTVTATAQAGFSLVGESQWTVVDTAAACPVDAPVLQPVTGVAPTSTEVCGSDNDKVVLAVTEGVVYSASGWANGTNTVTVTAKDGYAVTGASTWTLTDSAATCPVAAASAPVGGGGGGAPSATAEATAVAAANDDTPVDTADATDAVDDTTVAAASDNVEGEDQLAYTGVSPAPVLGVAVLMLAAGLVMRRIRVRA
ncbi:MAG TPA: hypothetical protein PLQ63_13210, partial [Propionicimonas sp.]|nr:hypothetical protein [Propionicimonas sp.]